MLAIEFILIVLMRTMIGRKWIFFFYLYRKTYIFSNLFFSHLLVFFFLFLFYNFMWNLFEEANPIFDFLLCFLEHFFKLRMILLKLPFSIYETHEVLGIPFLLDSFDVQEKFRMELDKYSEYFLLTTLISFSNFI